MTQPIQTCFRHPGARAGVSCQRCGRPICPSCMNQASVGFQCPECVRGSSRSSPVLRFRDLRTDRPVVTIALIALNVVGFLAVVATGGSPWNGGGRATDQGMTLGHGLLWNRQGSWVAMEPIGVAHGEWWRIVTGGFLHAGLLHLGMNMLLLWLLGSQLEAVLGRARFASLYLACLVGGSLGALWVSPTTGTVGASGAVFGLMGAAVVAQRRSGIDVWRNGIGGLVVVNLLLTFAVPGIAIGAHVGGLVAGVAVGALVFALDRAIGSSWAGTLACLAITAVLWFGCVIVSSHAVS